MSQHRRDQCVIVVGGGLAGLMATLHLAEAGISVDLFSLVPVRRSHSACAQGGINAAVDTKGEGDSPWIHFVETIYGGDFLADQPPVLKMCEAGPELVYLLDRMGVPFNRTPTGELEVTKRGGGTKYSRGLFAGASTGQQMLYALDEQVRRHEAEGRVRKFEGWTLCSLLLDSAGRCRGISAMPLAAKMTVHAFPAWGVLLATGGCGGLYAKTTTSLICNGAAASLAYQQGAHYGNPEFIQFHPTAIPGEDKCRLVSESLRGGGGRLWTYRGGKPWYFLEEWYPAFGNLVPRDIASRAIYRVCREMDLGIDGKDQVYLDVTHLDSRQLEVEFGGAIEIYEKYTGEDPRTVPMRVFPAVHYSMGGLWVDASHRSNLEGLYAAGECEHLYHGANRLGANALLACLHGGKVVAQSVVEDLDQEASPLPGREIEAEVERQEDWNRRLLEGGGSENPFELYWTLREAMSHYVAVVRTSPDLQKMREILTELKVRYTNLNLGDSGRWANPALALARDLGHMMVLAETVTAGALAREESRGAHYRPEFPERDDSRWLKTTVAQWTPDGPRLWYVPVDTSLLTPRPRSYATDFLEEVRR